MPPRGSGIGDISHQGKSPHYGYGLRIHYPRNFPFQAILPEAVVRAKEVRRFKEVLAHAFDGFSQPRRGSEQVQNFVGIVC